MAIGSYRILHLTRYFLILGILSFALHWTQTAGQFSLVLIGPAIEIAWAVRQFLGNFIDFADSAVLYDFGLLLPVVILYFGFAGFLLKKLWNEHGTVKILSLLSFFLFLGYIHYAATQHLADFYATPGTVGIS